MSDDDECVMNPQDSDTEIDGRGVSELLRGIEGADERIALAREQLANGEGVTLDEI